MRKENAQCNARPRWATLETTAAVNHYLAHQSRYLIAWSITPMGKRQQKLNSPPITTSGTSFQSLRTAANTSRTVRAKRRFP